MSAYIAVFDNPFFGVSGADGKWTIKNLPDGDYTLVAWQEKLGKQEQKVTIKDGKPAADIVFTFKPDAAAMAPEVKEVILASSSGDKDKSPAPPAMQPPQTSAKTVAGQVISIRIFGLRDFGHPRLNPQSANPKSKIERSSLVRINAIESGDTGRTRFVHRCRCRLRMFLQFNRSRRRRQSRLGKLVASTEPFQPRRRDRHALQLDLLDHHHHLPPLRRRPGRLPDQIPPPARPKSRTSPTATTRLEFVWTIVPAVILLSSWPWSASSSGTTIATNPAGEDPNRAIVLVVGQQFKWNVIYPGPRQKLGRYLLFPDPPIWLAKPGRR